MIIQYLKLILKFLIRNRLTQYIVSTIFHIIYYHSEDTWLKNEYMGFPVQQNPFDLHLYQELIFNLKPEFILQTGVYKGGSIMYFASLLDIMKIDQDVKVIGIDINLSEQANRIANPRVSLLEGDSTNHEMVERIKSMLPTQKLGLLILDSNHTMHHVLKELEIYEVFLKVGSYLVVEDTNLNGHPVNPFFGSGPYEAVNEFLEKNKSYIRDDKIWKRNKFSFHQYGWLKKIK